MNKIIYPNELFFDIVKKMWTLTVNVDSYLKF